MIGALDERLTIANLAAVSGDRGHFLVLKYVLSGALGNSQLSTPLPLQLLEKALPNFLPVFQIKIFVAEHHVDAANEGVVELPHSIGGEEQNTLVIFHCSQEDCRIDKVNKAVL